MRLSHVSNSMRKLFWFDIVEELWMWVRLFTGLENATALQYNPVRATVYYMYPVGLCRFCFTILTSVDWELGLGTG